jgi:hypothetical protein
MKNILITLGVLGFLSAKSQISFLEASQHTISPNSMGVVNGFQWNDTTYFALYSAYYGLGHRAAHIVEYDEYGKRRKEITPTIHYGGSIVNNLSKIGNDKFYLWGSGDDTLGRFATFNYMYDKNWNVLWSKGYDFRYRDISVVNDSVGIASVQIRNYKTGIAALNLNTGDTIWTKSYNNTISINDSVNSGLSFVNLTSSKENIFILFQKYNADLNIISVLKHDGSFVRNDTIRSPVFDQTIYRMENGYFFLSIYNSSKNLDLICMENAIKFHCDSIRSSNSISKNNIILESKGNIHLSIKHWIGSGFVNNVCELRTYDKSKRMKGSIEFRVKDFDLTLNLEFVCGDGGYFFTGSTSYLAPENRSFIMKTDSNGFVSNPRLFPLEIDTTLQPQDTVSFIMFTSRSSDNLTIFPNPTYSFFTISSTQLGALGYTLHSPNGQMVGNGSFEESTQVYVSQLPVGLYFLQMQGERVLERRKVVVGHR